MKSNENVSCFPLQNCSKLQRTEIKKKEEKENIFKMVERWNQRFFVFFCRWHILYEAEQA